MSEDTSIWLLICLGINFRLMSASFQCCCWKARRIYVSKFRAFSLFPEFLSFHDDVVWNGSTLYVGYSVNPSNLKSHDLQSWDILLNYFSNEFLPSVFSVLSFRNFYCLDVESPRPLSLFATGSFLKIYLWLFVALSFHYCIFIF